MGGPIGHKLFKVRQYVNLQRNAGRDSLPSMKTFTVIGREWTRAHGYLATRCSMDIEAKNKTHAINKARELRNAGEGFSGCNNFIAFPTDCPEQNPLAMSWVEREMERDYWKQEDRYSNDPQIVPQGYYD